MKLSDKTISILKNFYLINPSIVFPVGNVIGSISPTDSIIARAEVEDTFEKEFCVYDINRFLATLNLFENPNVEIKEKSVTISDQDTSIDYVCASKTFIKTPPEKRFGAPDPVACHFTLTNDHFQKIKKSMGILGLPDISIEGDGSKLIIRGTDTEKKVQDSYNYVIGETKNVFKAIIKLENIIILPIDYEVKIGKIKNVKLAYFKGLEENIEYWISVDRHSEY